VEAEVVDLPGIYSLSPYTPEEIVTRDFLLNEKTDQHIYDINFNEGVAIIMGSEDRGVNPSVLKIVDEKAKLPMFGTIESLNVSVACGAFLYEALRQRM
jgi:tRNA G18 (ribose-2'-O)-methylase SpoU